MSTFDDLVHSTHQELSGLGLVQPVSSYLTAGIDADDLTISVSNAGGFSQGVAEIGTELVYIDSVDTTASTLTVSPDGRGYYGTTAAAHLADVRIEYAPPWSKHSIARALNETIEGTYPALFGVGSTSFTFSPAVTTYSIPAEAERILSVTADTIGPSQEQERITRFSFNASAPAADFATTNSITLERAPFPGRTVTVTYAKRPVAITYGSAFTASGLAESARTAIRLGAASSLLSFIDTSRLVVDTAIAGEFDASRSQAGTASRISLQLLQRYELELDRERKRLLATHPTAITLRTR